MKPRTIVLAAITALSAAGLYSNQAAAMPTTNLAAASDAISLSQDVAWVCGPFRCWWAPRRAYYRPVVVAPRVYYAPAYYGYGYGCCGYGGYGAWYGWGVRPRVVVAPRWYGYRRGFYRRW
jgi:hypothetical protein